MRKKISLVKPEDASGNDPDLATGIDGGAVDPQKTVPDDLNLEEIEQIDTRKAKKAGKPVYKYQKSFRKANICEKFFYVYGNPVVASVEQNNGVLKMENIEDIKLDDDETLRLVN